MHLVGIDIGGTKCAVVLAKYCDGMLRIIERSVFKTADCNGWREVIEAFFRETDAILSRYGNEKISAIGISCGGPLDSVKGLIKCPPNLPDWDDVPVCELFSRKYSVPVFLQNDANACAVAEWKFGAGKGLKNIVFLTFGTGMGAGLILNGRLYSGTNDMAGEVGHIRIAEDGPEGYGKRGSFEGFCSGGGIKRLAQEMYHSMKPCTILDESDFSARAIAEAAVNGDEFAISVYDKCGSMLGRGLSVLIDILNPEAIIIGSIFERSGDLLKDRMFEVIEKEALSYASGVCKILPAKLSDSIGDYAAIGVAANGLEKEND